MIVFHRVLIATAIAFSFGFGAWSYVGFRADAEPVLLGLAVTFGAIGVALTYYLINLNRFLHR